MRVPSAKVIDIAELDAHKLAFHKPSSKDGSGKCDVVHSPQDKVLGVLFQIDAREKPILDCFEGLGHGYAEKTVGIRTEAGKITTAVTYYATKTDPQLKPYTWYKRHVLEGAKEAGLPASYVEAIENVGAIADSNKDREAKELAIYS